MLTTAIAALAKLVELRRNERLTRAGLEAVKLAKFRRLVAYAVRRAPYYADIVAARGLDVATCTPADFPVLTKSDLMASFDRIVTDPRITKQGVTEFLARSRDPSELFLRRYRVIHTSGTSGEVGYFVYAPSDWVRGLLVTARRRRRGLRLRGLRRIRMAFYGATGGHYAGVTMLSAADRGLARLFIQTGLFEVNRPLAETVAALNAFEPDVLSGYTNALKALAEQQRRGALRIAPRAVSAVGETMSPADAALLEDAFGVEPVSGYGSSEHLMMGASNPDGRTMTLFDDDLIYEFHDDHCVVTNLFNHTEPLIRYRMSDILRPVAHGEPAPRELVVDTLVGRTELAPTFVNASGEAEFISPVTIAEIFVPGVSRFQMHVTGEASFRFLATLDGGLGPQGRADAAAGLERRLGEILAEKRLDNVAYEIAVVDTLPPDPRSRKFKLIVDDRVPAPA